MSEPKVHPAATPEARRAGRRAELGVFLLLSVVLWPFLSVAFVGGYGFLVWIWQIIFGPPGPPN